MANRVKFGRRSVTELPSEVERLGGGSALIITDSGVKKAGIVNQVTKNFSGDIDISVFDGVEPDPSIAVFESALSCAHEFEPDVVIGVGGGSSIDVTKTTGVIYRHGGEVLDYIASPTGKGKPVPGASLPIIAVPTTAGTGSETSPVSVVSLPEEKTKAGISSRHQYPNLALVDPSLTVSLPPGPTAASGMDALCHAIESYTTRRFDMKERPSIPDDRPEYTGRSILTDQLSRKAIELIAENLRPAVNNGSNLEARRNMSLGSLMAGIAFTNAGLGATHAMAYPVAGKHHTPHGVTVATLLPEVMRFNATGAFDRYEDIAELMGEQVEGMSQDAAADKAATAVAKLAADVNIPQNLEELGVTKAEIPTLAKDTMEIQRLLVGNPRHVRQEDIEQIFYRSL